MRAFLLPCTLWLCAALCLWPLHAQTQPASAPASSTATPAPAANPKTPEEFFARARQLSDLEAAGIPFHLKATFFASGDAEFTGNGTYEEWWASKDIWRKQATLGDYKYVAIQNLQKNADSATSDYMPLRLRQVMGLQITHIGLPEKNPGEWKLSQITEGHDTLEDVTKQWSCIPNHIDKNELCVELYEFTGSGVLLSYSRNSYSETYSNFQPFGKFSIPRNIASTLQGDPVLTVGVVLLEPLHPGDRNLLDTQSIPDYHATPAQLLEDIPTKGVTPPKILHMQNPKYPESERGHYSNRMVLVAFGVDTTGTVREPYVLISDGALFDKAAMQAVRKYKFKPAMQNGQPVIVDVYTAIEFHAR